MVLLRQAGPGSTRVEGVRHLRVTIVSITLGCALGVTACAGRRPAQEPARPAAVRPPVLSAEDDALLEDLSKRSFLFFWEQADPATGIVRDRSRTNGSPVDGAARDIGSIAAVGFGLSGLCIAAERGWVPHPQAVERARTTLRFFATRMPHERGWFFHFV